MSSIIHSRVALSASDIAFVRECLIGSSGSGGGEGGGAIGIRLDGRAVDSYRTFDHNHSNSSDNLNSISLTRTNDSASCEASISSGGGGSTRVLAVVRGTIVAPYPDRPSEGILQVNACMSVGSVLNAACSSGAGGTGFGIYPPTSAELTRHLERILKETDTIDLEVCMRLFARKRMMV